MCAAPPVLPYSNLPRSSGVQVPSLRGISIPLLEPCPSLSSSGPPSSVDSPRIARPALYRIDTDSAAKMVSHHNGMVRAMGHRHSRSLEVPSQSVPVSASDPLNSAVSDSFLLPWSKESEPSHELPSSPLHGPYISRSCRRNSGVVTSVPPLMPALPSLAPALGPPSPIFDSSEDTAESEEDIDSEDVWDLVPYDISWGSAYYGYSEGTLPGPDGKCIFLRSPTPLKYQRTGQACEKCRERKAKCSGTRPSCARCMTRGLTCAYAPDSKRARSEDLTDESGMCPAPTDLHSAHSSPASPLAGRIRRNTDCGSHAARVRALNSNVTLRRRHSTIGLSVSAPLSLGCRAPREPRLARHATRNNTGRGFLGSLLDPLIVFPGDGVEGDDLCISESIRSSYQTLPQNADSFAPQTSLTPSELDAGVPDETAHELLPEQESQCNGWDAQALIHDGLVSRENSAAMRVLPSDLLEDRSTCTDSFPSVSSELRYSNTMYDAAYAQQTLDAECVQSYSILAAGSGGMFNGCSAELDYYMSDASRIGMLPGEDVLWPCNGVAQPKVETVGFPFDMDLPHRRSKPHTRFLPL